MTAIVGKGDRQNQFLRSTDMTANGTFEPFSNNVNYLYS
jgi:hypothetical protein